MLLIGPDGVGAQTLRGLAVTTRSSLGALAYHTGGVLIDGGWLRLLGGGNPSLNLLTVNGLDDPERNAPDHLVVAVDVLGGRFAINGGGLPGELGEVLYFAPDELDWMSTGLGHAQFVRWTLAGEVDAFYSDWRWDGWEADVNALANDQGLLWFPPMFTVEGRDHANAGRRVVPMHELFGVYDEYALQLREVAAEADEDGETT